MAYNYPLRLKSKISGDTYDFININTGVLVSDTHGRSDRIGITFKGLVQHPDDTWWEVVEVVITLKRKLHDAVGGFKCHT